MPQIPPLTHASDAFSLLLSRLPIPHIALVPGSSFRGLHDSLVNFLPLRVPSPPSLLVCLHEEHAVALAHGYAKVTGGKKLMAAAVHANVGLMHASMAIYNAWCDRVPVLVIGATGPVDAGRRRPWIDWIHSAQDQGGLVRGFVKFDDLPLGVDAGVEALLRGYVTAVTRPCGPTYICLDVGLQEGEVEGGEDGVRWPDVERYLDAVKPREPGREDVERVVEALSGAEKVVFMFGRVGREMRCWKERIELAKRFDARVVTDLKQAAAFPTEHYLHGSPPAIFITPQTAELIKSADLIVSFDWVDLGGTIKAAVGDQAEPKGKVVHISLDSILHNGWSKDHFALPPADISVFADPDQTLSALLTATKDLPTRIGSWPVDQKARKDKIVVSEKDHIFVSDLSKALYTILSPDEMCIARLPLGWIGSDFRATHPLSFLGMDGGAGVGSGPGMMVGAALAVKEEFPNLLTVGVLGDGDFLMGNSAIWTAARYRIPMLIIVANNASYFNDETHQERVAKQRGRLVENKGVGIRLDDPVPNLHDISKGLGCSIVRSEQVKELNDLVPAIRDAVKAVREGEPVVLDVQVLPDGYSSAMSEQVKSTTS